MVSSRQRSRRQLLTMMGSALAAAFALRALRWPSPSLARRDVPDSLRLLASSDTCRQARRRVQVQPCAPQAVRAAHDRINAPEDFGARDRYERQRRQDFAAGRVAVVRGWVVAETELAVLSMLER